MSDENRIEVIRSEGIFQEVAGRTLRPFPPKVPFVHRWIVIVTHTVSDKEAKDIKQGNPTILLDLENLVDVNYGCVDCEGGLLDVYGTPCPAPDFESPS